MDFPQTETGELNPRSLPLRRCLQFRHTCANLRKHRQIPAKPTKTENMQESKDWVAERVAKISLPGKSEEVQNLFNILHLVNFLS